MKYFKISFILCVISIVCALAIAGMNMLTSDTILKNEEAKELTACQAIFDDYDQDKSKILFVAKLSDESIQKVVLACDNSGNELGYLYTVYGKNSFGAIKLLVAIKNNTIYQVEFLENGQTVANVENHVRENYPMSEKNVVEINPWGSEEFVSVDALDEASLLALDTKCGGTYGAELVKSLVTLALNDSKEASKYE